MCWTEPRWRPTVWSRRAALSSVALPPWALWRASSTARWVKKKTSPLFLCQPLSLQQQLHKCWCSPVAVYLLVALYVSKAAGSSSGYSVSWRGKRHFNILVLLPLLTSRRLPGDYWRKEQRHLPESLHQLALPGTHWPDLSFIRISTVILTCCFLFSNSGGGEGPCRGAFVGPPAAWGVCAGRSADGDHRDPSVTASRRRGVLLSNRRPSGRLREHSSPVCFEETEPAEPGKSQATNLLDLILDYFKLKTDFFTSLIWCNSWNKLLEWDITQWGIILKCKLM